MERTQTFSLFPTTPLLCVYVRAMNLSPKRIHYSSILRVLKSSLSMSSVPIATFEEVKDLPNHPEKLLIDVREPAEIAETGVIPTAINIPCKSVVELNFWEFSTNPVPSGSSAAFVLRRAFGSRVWDHFQGEKAQTRRSPDFLVQNRQSVGSGHPANIADGLHEVSKQDNTDSVISWCRLTL